MAKSKDKKELIYGFMNDFKKEERKYILENWDSVAPKRPLPLAFLFRNADEEYLESIEKAENQLKLRFREKKIQDLYFMLIDEIDRVDEFVEKITNKLVDKYSEVIDLHIVDLEPRIERNDNMFREFGFEIINHIHFDRFEAIYVTKETHKGDYICKKQLLI